MIEELDKELERLRQLRDSLDFDLEILNEREKDFKRVNRNLFYNIQVKRNEIYLSESKIKGIAESIYKEISFYLQIKDREPVEVESIEEPEFSIPVEPVKKKWWKRKRHVNSNVV